MTAARRLAAVLAASAAIVLAGGAVSWGDKR